MKYLFLVQGEGRGHMTQAISLSNILTQAGHEVVHVMVGKSERREIPAFFYEKINAPVTLFESPNFLVDAKNKKISIWRTIIYNSLKLVTFIKSLRTINKTVKSAKPDVIINFYDLLGGLYIGLYKPKSKYVCVGHQFLLLHPDFIFPKGFAVDKFLMNINTWFSSLRADKHLALSFRPMPDVEKKKIYVVPPLLRDEIKNLTPTDEGFIHGYMLNSGYSEEIERWHKLNSSVILHFFWDKKEAPEDLQVGPNLAFHKINDKKFLDYMARCKGYCSTAGFESICEAMYLGKPIMMVPTYGHFEQACNALDASLAGAGTHVNTFDLSALIRYIPEHKDISDNFKKWADSSKEKFLKLLTEF
jgi:uncharacterized protein (TIGR00661 family)